MSEPEVHKDFLKYADQYYVLATSVLADHETRVLKQGETFAIFDSYGDVQPVTHSESGVFYRGTRYLSRYEIGMCKDLRPLLLNSTLRDDNGLLKIDMTNRDLHLAGEVFIPKGTLYIHREKFVLDGACLEKIEIFNYGWVDVATDMSMRLSADFVDIFEVRGTKREKRGQLNPAVQIGDRVVYSYMGLDGIERRTGFRIRGTDYRLDKDTIRFDVKIPARGRVKFTCELDFEESQLTVSSRESSADYEEGLKKNHSDHLAGRHRYCRLRSSNEQFDAWMRRSTDDLVMMTTATEEKQLYPYAGIPWFCAPFGRDGIITALECLWANPSLALGVLHYLAKTQAIERVPERDSTPGKIIHEVRFGEMANLKEIPFGLYYGSVDSTPLFLCLAGAYYTRTGDQETVKKLWPAFEKAIHWLDRHGDLDGDGFIEYQRENPRGLVQQGWKDSSDSVFHADGTDARGPIALCEVQAYTYMARLEGAKLAELVGHMDFAADQRGKAMALKDEFDKAFWVEELGTFALALDGDKKPCKVKSSNAGQCLFTGIVKEARVKRLVETLMHAESFSGWGVRTIATDAIRYNPMSYHNGSIWPHDTALVAWGLAKYGFKNEVARLFNGLFKSAIYMEQMRMPEVFCGFERRESEAPTLYPHACAPQAWAAGSIYMVIQALLGLEIDAPRNRVTLSHPHLPEALESLKITNLVVGCEAGGHETTGSIDIMVQNYYSDVSVQLTRRAPGISVTVEK